MGQKQSDLYECDTDSGEGSTSSGRTSTQFVEGSKLAASRRESQWDDNQKSERRDTKKLRNITMPQGSAASANYQTDSARDKSKRRPPANAMALTKATAPASDKTSLEQQQRHVRKLSNVSNRNIQLLSMRPRSEKDTYADGLRSRRRSSLINLILGAPSRGPRFSEDLCSLSSHMSELCNFGIDYFPDAPQTQTVNYHESGFGGGAGFRRPASRLSSINSSLSRLDDGQRVVDLYPNPKSSLGQQQQQAVGSRGFAPLERGVRRRGSSLGSLTSFEAETLATASKNVQCPDRELAEGPTNGQTTLHKDCVTRPTNQLEGSHQRPGSNDAGQRGPSLCSMFLASVDLTSSLDDHSESRGEILTSKQSNRAEPVTKPTGRINHKARQMMIHRSGSELSLYSAASAGSSLNQLHHKPYSRHFSKGNSIGSVMFEAAGAKSRELGPGKSVRRRRPSPSVNEQTAAGSHLRETKLIIMLQVCLPFILAGFGNMSAGLVLNQIAHWEAFQRVPVFFVLLPSFVGLKGNIEMTLASRLSTLSNLNLLDTSYQRRRAFFTNLILILSQAIGLSLFAALASVACELVMGKLDGGLGALEITGLIVLPTALATALTLVIVSSIVMWLAICLANKLQVNPDNLSTLMAALYGDVSCVLTYGMFAQLMYSLNQNHGPDSATTSATVVAWPLGIVTVTLVSWPLLVYMARRCRETQELALSSIPPMLVAIVVSLGSGTVLSLVVDKFSRVALYQPVVNGFGANLIAVQASRVSTWLWCTALRRLSAETPPSSQSYTKTQALEGQGFNFEFEPNDKLPYGSLASFIDPPTTRSECSISKSTIDETASKRCWLIRVLGRLLEPCAKLTRLLLWSFVNSTPNSVAARLLLVMLIPAHSLYFVVIWLLAPTHHVTLTWIFYIIYISLCLVQVFVLLAICQPLMTMLMLRHLDPDVFGISLLMALADLIGTICLTGGFYLMASLGDSNAT